MPGPIFGGGGITIGPGGAQSYDAGLTSLAAADTAPGQPYVTAANTWTSLANPAANQPGSVLSWDGSGSPTWAIYWHGWAKYIEVSTASGMTSGDPRWYGGSYAPANSWNSSYAWGVGVVRAVSGSYRYTACLFNPNNANGNVGGFYSQNPTFNLDELRAFEMTAVFFTAVNAKYCWGFDTQYFGAGHGTTLTGSGIVFRCYGGTDTNFKIMHRDGATATTTIDTGVAWSSAGGYVFQLIRVSTTRVDWRILDALTRALLGSGSITTNLPAAGTDMYAGHESTNLTANNWWLGMVSMKIALA